MKKCLIFFTNPITLSEQIDFVVQNNSGGIWNEDNVLDNPIAFYDGVDFSFHKMETNLTLHDSSIILLLDNLAVETVYSTFISSVTSSNSEFSFVFIRHTSPSENIIQSIENNHQGIKILESNHTKSAPNSKYFLLTQFLSNEEFFSEIQEKIILPKNISIEDFMHLIETDALPIQSKWLQLAMVTRNIQDRINQYCTFTIEEETVLSRKDFFNIFKNVIIANANTSSLKVQSVQGKQTYSDIFDWDGLNVNEFEGIISSAQNWDSFETKIQNKLTEILTK